MNGNENSRNSPPDAEFPKQMDVTPRLKGYLVKFSEDGPRDVFTKQDILEICHHDTIAAHLALTELARLGGVELLGEFDKLENSEAAVRVFLEKLSKTMRQTQSSVQSRK